MRPNIWSRLLVVLVCSWLILASAVAWVMRPVITDLGFAVSPSPNPLWHLSSGAPFVITPNIPGLLSLYVAPIIGLLLLFGAATWVARGARTSGNA